MRYRRFGRTELLMPLFSCGGMRYQFFRKDLPNWLISSRSQANIEAIVHRALTLGINHFETARDYGTSERQLGRVLAEVPRDRLIVQTKVVPQANAADFRQIFEISWQNLGLDQLDLLAIHGINTSELMDYTLRTGGCLAAARKLQQEGRVRFVGFSTHASTALIQQVIETGEFDFVNLHWYYINQNNWPAIAAAERHDMGVFIISPTDKGGHLYDPPSQLVDLCRPLSPMVFNDLFCLSHPQVHTLSLGAARPSDFDEHFKTLPLLDQSDAVLSPILNRLEQRAIATLGQDWWQTWRKGLPSPDQTPDQINIPVMLWLHNLLLAYDMEGFAKARYNLLGRGGHWFPGNRGDRLGELDLSDCLKASPHGDRIPELLADTHRRLVGKRQTRLTQQWAFWRTFWRAFWKQRPFQRQQRSGTASSPKLQSSISTITVVHAWHDDNRGDCAFLIGMLTALHQQLPHAKIRLISSFAADDAAFEGAYRHTLQAFPQLEIIPAPFWAYNTQDQGKWAKLQMAFSGLLAGANLIVPNSTALLGTSAAIQCLQNSDVMIAAGGHIQPVASHPWKSLYLAVRTLYFLLWAKRYGRPYWMFSRSFDLGGLAMPDAANPTENNGLQTERLDARLLRFILSEATAICPRGDRSLQSLVALGLPKAQLRVMPDGSFFLDAPSSSATQTILSTYGLTVEGYWVVTVKQCPPHTESFLQEMARLVHRVLQDSRAKKIVIVAQSLGPDANGDDRPPTHELMAYLRQQGVRPEQAITIEDDLSPETLLALYGAAQLVVGTRLQSVILGFVAGTPGYAIAYTSVKAQDIMSMMGMESLCTTVEHFSANNTLAQIDELDLAMLRQQIPPKVRLLKQQLFDEMLVVLSAVSPKAFKV